MSKKKDKVEISKMMITIGGKEIEVTIEEAQQLKDKLNNLFGTTENHYHYTNPIIERVIEKERRPYWYWTVPYCGTTTAEYPVTSNAIGDSIDLSQPSVSLLDCNDNCLQTY